MNFNETNSRVNIKPELMTDNVKEVLNFEKEDNKAVVLSSGGLDSLVVLKYAIERFGAKNVITLDAFYDQNHLIEMSCSKRIAEHFGVRRVTIDISSIFQYSDSAMLKKNGDKIIHKSYYEQIYGPNGTRAKKTVSTYCPNRNSILIQSAGAIALSFGARYVLIGAHADDAAGNAYKDCTRSFFEASKKALEEGTDPEVTLLDPIIDCSKTENVTIGLALGLTEDEFAMSFSCYDPVEIDGGFKACISNGEENACATCRDRFEALSINGLNPKINTIYKEES